MITATKNPSTENNNGSEFLQARNKLKKVASADVAAKATLYQDQEAASENIQVALDDNSRQERTLAILTDAANLDDIIQHIKDNGFTVIATKHFEFTSEEAERFYEDHSKQNYYEKCVRWLSSSKLYALVLEKENAIKDWRQLMGPTTYKKARKTSPNSVRALFGKDASQNATHGSESDEGAAKEIEYLFGGLSTLAATDNINEVSQLQEEKKIADVGTAPTINTEEAAIVPEKDSLSIEATSAPIIAEQEKQEETDQKSKDVKDAQNSIAQENKTTNALVNQVNAEIKPSTVDISSIEEEKEQVEAKEEDQQAQENNIIVSAATTITTTAASVATTVISSVAEAASGISEAATAVSEAIVNSGDDEKKQDDHTNNDIPEQKAVTIIETPIIRDIPDPAAKYQESATSAQPDNNQLNNNDAETGDVVPEIQNVADQEISNSDGEGNKSVSTTNWDKSPLEEAKPADTTTNQENDSSKTSAPNDSIANGVKNTIEASKNASQDAVKKAVKKNGANTSNSRIRPPSINKGRPTTAKETLADAVKKPIEESDTKMRFQPRTKASSSGGSANGTGATRIARLSAPTKKAAEKPPAAAAAAAAAQAQTQAKKAVTKVSKHLPRVATLAKPPVASSKAELESKDGVNATEKPKKRLSSTKSFISRLTAPTVASANKKAAASATTIEPENAAPARRSSTLKKRQSLVVKPTKSNSVEPQISNNKGKSTPQQQPCNEMTSISTNDSLSRPTTPSKHADSSDKKEAFLDSVVETTT